jgi:hypothetical protein
MAGNGRRDKPERADPQENVKIQLDRFGNAALCNECSVG